MEGEGRVARQIGGRAWYASVTVALSEATQREVEFAASAFDKWYQEQGWLDAAISGALLGLELAGYVARVQIVRVHGMYSDTSRGVMTLAGVRAVWTAMGFTPPDSLVVAMENCIPRGHQLSPDAIRSELLLAAGNSN